MDEYVRVTVRFPKDIAEWLRDQAHEQNRSMNGQLVEFLKRLKRQSEPADELG